MAIVRVIAGFILLVLASAAPGEAGIDKIDIKTREPFYTSRIGPYVKITGTFQGSLDSSEAIPGLAKATRRADGRVGYTGEFIILAPESLKAGNRVLLFDVENRGNPVTHGLYNSEIGASVRAVEVGNGFLEDNGYIVAAAGWQNGKGIELPTIPGPNGKPVALDAVGFAAIRDVVDFLRHEPRDRAGTPNPIAGAVDYALAAGSSQTSRVLKSFVYHGFNRTKTRPVFDGLHLHVGQSGTMPFIPPADASPETVALAITGDSSVYPFTYAEIEAPLADHGEKPPKIIATNVQGDYYRRRQSLVRTGANGTTDVPLPENVRIWDVAGGSHGLLPAEDCDMPRANVEWHPLLRAALVRLTRWVVGNEAPPPTKLLELVPSSPVPYLNPPPKDYPKATLLVPRRDADGNALGGVRLPAVAVPLGTFGGWNAPLETTCGDMSVFFYAFARTRFQRIMTGDGRLSLEERYGTADEYLRRFADSAKTLVTEGYLLEADAKALIAGAEKARSQFPPPKEPAR
jgi:hypothetical protein